MKCLIQKTVVRLALITIILGMGCVTYAEEYTVPEKGKVVSVTCQELPDYKYDVFVPESYDPAKPCAIIYTFSPGGGGMIKQHQIANEVTPTIVVGIKGSKNGLPERKYVGEIYAVLLDTHERFNLDPGAQFCGGLSGGSVVAYGVARRSKYIGGVIASGGWLQKQYDPWCVYPRGLLVARIAGVDDKGALSWLKQDADHLAKFGCKCKDWSQPGGHLMGTPENVKEAMKWLVAGKAPDKTEAVAKEKAKKWEAAPYAPATIKEMLEAVKNAPRSQLGNLAIRQFMRIMKDDAQFCKTTIPASTAGDFNTFFGYIAYDAALAGDRPRFVSAAYALDKVCPDKKNRWRACIATLMLFGAVGDDKNVPFVLKYIGNPSTTPGLPVFHRAVYAAALLKSGKRIDATSMIAKLPTKSEDARLATIVADLKANATEKEPALDADVWIDVLNEGDQATSKK